jgi:formylglycine-generating enzyme required for sulfatase activity
LDTAKVAVLLVSPHFLASDFIANDEVPPLLKAAEEERLTILWVAVSASLYRETPLAAYQSANDPARPLDSLSPAQVNAELVKIAQLIKQTTTRPIPPRQEGLQEGHPFPTAQKRLSPRQPFEPEMILIPAGNFLMGSDPQQDEEAIRDEQPQHRLYLPDYYLAKTPVTHEQYRIFVRATGHEAPRGWTKRAPPHGMGLDVWVARNDRSREVQGYRFADLPHLRAELPLQFDEATNRTIELIDVLWLRGNATVAAFEKAVWSQLSDHCPVAVELWVR